jgi:hypothetical protein
MEQYDCLHSAFLWLFNVTVHEDGSLECDLAIAGKRQKPETVLTDDKSGQQFRVYLPEEWQNNPTQTSAAGEVEFTYVYA